jgi:hypothetical protein
MQSLGVGVGEVGVQQGWVVGTPTLVDEAQQGVADFLGEFSQPFESAKK